MLVRRIELPGRPDQVLAAWPRDRALAVLWSGGAGDEGASRWSRWTILAEPQECVSGRALADAERGILRTAGVAGARAENEPPFIGGWIGYFGYGLGRSIEPAAALENAPPDERGWPNLVLHRCPGAYVYDNLLDRWWAVGEERDIARLPRRFESSTPHSHDPHDPPDEAGFRIGQFRSATGRENYERAVGRVLRYILDGDIYQANLSHRLSGDFSGSTREFFGALTAAVGPWYGGYLEVPGEHDRRRVMVSASPELFLQLEGSSRRVVTRPMKGTRPLGVGAGALRDSAKDRAELAMIIDLVRNDLGRVCRFGSVRVEEARAIERHGSSVWQGVASVSGILREGVGFGDLLRATFPGGSVTGAPKIRAMQIIEELEPVARGPYCGAFGYISDCGNAALAMSIRTALVSGPPDRALGREDAIASGVLDYSVGAGIVADSQPRPEWEETLAKAAILEMVRPAQGAAR